MKEIFFTRHALQKLFKEKLSEEVAVRAVREGAIVYEGKSKFKAILRARDCLLIAVCCEYADYILVITVLKKKG